MASGAFASFWGLIGVLYCTQPPMLSWCSSLFLNTCGPFYLSLHNADVSHPDATEMLIAPHPRPPIPVCDFPQVQCLLIHSLGKWVWCLPPSAHFDDVPFPPGANAPPSCSPLPFFLKFSCLFGCGISYTHPPPTALPLVIIRVWCDHFLFSSSTFFPKPFGFLSESLTQMPTRQRQF